MLTFNEGKVCDAIIRHLEARDNASRSEVRFPEEENHTSPVEMVFKIDSQLWSLEHTGIEPFADFIKLEAQAPQILQPIIDAVNQDLDPAGVFELHIPALAFQNILQRDIPVVQTALINWIKATAPTIHGRRYGDYIKNIAPCTPPGVPFHVSLYRFNTPTKMPRFQIKHIVAGNVEQARLSRIQDACDRKFPKLHWWKTAESARTILVLEDNDIQLTNEVLVADAFLPIAQARSDRPDETYLVATLGDAWYVWPILVGPETYFDLAERYGTKVSWIIDPKTLTPLTKR